MLKYPNTKYLPFTPIVMPDRQWPSAVLRNAPVWVSTDLRDGNQALVKPLTEEEKILFFRRLVSCGFKEIEIAFPSASDTEFMFVRKLIESDEIPDDICIQVMAPSREDLLRRTFDAVRGAKNVAIQLYCATSPLFREVIFKCSEEDLINKAVKHTAIVRQLADEQSALYGTKFRLVYGLESFSQSNLDFVIQICTEVQNTWHSSNLFDAHKEKVVFNLAATVESASPNHFADQVEYFRRNMPQDTPFIIGVHTHNDRGTAVASTEMALLAGAERVDGCLLGNGERTGNADLVTLALNIYSQGISPGLDFSDLGAIAELVSKYTRIPIHPRHPYVGSLIFTAYSGGHQDGIKKGFQAMAIRHKRAELLGQPKIWQIPYLPVDPTDFGFTYEAIRINSQSGKAGIAYVTEQLFGVALPRSVQEDFAGVIQSVCDQQRTDLSSTEIFNIFRTTYHLRENVALKPAPYLTLTNVVRTVVHAQNNTVIYQGRVTLDGVEGPFLAEADKTVMRFMEYLNDQISVRLSAEEIGNEDQKQHSTSFIQLHIHQNETISGWIGIGQDPDRIVAKLKGITNAFNRARENGLNLAFQGKR